MLKKPLTVVWISDFPIEWLPDLPSPLRALPRRHPATWQMVLLSEFERNPDLRLHVVLLRGRIASTFSCERNGVTFHILKAPGWMRLSSLFWTDTFMIRRLCKLLKPDLIHAWGIEKGAALIASRLNIPYLVTVQGLFAWYKRIVRLTPYFRFIEQLEKISIPRAPLVTSESVFAIEFLKRQFPGVRVYQAEHAPNPAFFDVKRRPQTDPAHFISVGDLSLRKGTDLLLRALERLTPDLPFRCTMVSSPDKSHIDSFCSDVSAKTLERIEFKEHLLPEEVAKELETPTLMLLPTRADVSPNAIKEAVVAGVPVVASNVGGIPDYVKPTKNGILFPAGDLEAFIHAIRTAMQNPVLGRGQVDPVSLAHSRKYLSPAQMAQNFLTAYDRVLETTSISG